MGIFDYLSPGLTVGTQALGAYKGGQANDALVRVQAAKAQQQDQIQSLLEAARLKRQQKQDRIASIIHGPNGQLLDMNDPANPTPIGPAPVTRKTTQELMQGDIAKLTATGVPLAEANRRVRLQYGEAPQLPRVERESSDVKDDRRRQNYIARRIQALTKPTKGIGALTKPGLSLEAATHQANAEWASVVGDDASGADPVVPPPVTPPPKTPANQAKGNIDLNTDPQHQREYDALAAQYQAALAEGRDPDTSRSIYDAEVLKIAKRHGQVR